MIYLVCFALSVLFAYFANKAKTRWKIVLFSVFSIAFPVLLAGLRGYTVGIDTENYYLKEWYWAGAVGADSLLDYLKMYFPKGYGDPLFALIIGSVAQLTGNYSIFLLIAHLVIMVGVYVGIFRHRRYVNPALVLLFFYLVYFNTSLNILRQYMAMAVLFAFLADIPQKRWTRYLVGVYIAFTIHSTAVIGLAPLLLYGILEFKKGRGLSSPKRAALVSGLLLAVVFLFKPLIRGLMYLGLLNDRFNFFLESNAVDPALIASMLIAMGLFFAIVFQKRIFSNCAYAHFYIFNSMFCLVLMQLSWSIAYGKRIAAYFAMADLITLGLVGRAPKTTFGRRLLQAGMILVALAYWLYIFAFRNASQTFPYVLSF